MGWIFVTRVYYRDLIFEVHYYTDSLAESAPGLRTGECHCFILYRLNPARVSCMYVPVPCTYCTVQVCMYSMINVQDKQGSAQEVGHAWMMLR
jgi:hypothetical protein